MKIGQGQAVQADTNNLKKAIVDMVRVLHPEEGTATSGLLGTIKINRGFNHPFLGRLLCPVNMNWDDANVQASIVENPGLASTTAWPLYFYPKGQFDPEDISKGLLRGELLVYAYKYIYLAPSVWCAPAQQDRPAGGNAQLHNMDSVTPRSIAYIASQVRFALSSGEANHKNGGLFCLSDFFWHVVKYLEEPLFEDDVKELLKWWDE
ncbi:hypothetical protein M422DRAFT_152696 [Sphaerobolus stellatus SS14]|nr:hypothetical protein M422DRAFT_152696 [Sphaerobolus stellatus SS14]